MYVNFNDVIYDIYINISYVIIYDMYKNKYLHILRI